MGASDTQTDIDRGPTLPTQPTHGKNKKRRRHTAHRIGMRAQCMHGMHACRKRSNQETYLLWQVPQTVLGVRRVDEVGISEQSPELFCLGSSAGTAKLCGRLLGSSLCSATARCIMPPLQPAQLPGAAERASQPNILLLMPDQWRWDWDGTHEAKLRVPHMASLQGLGTSFPYGATAPAPLCAPSRACFASLREYDEAGVANNLESDYPVDKQPTYFSALQDAGYHTMVAGKDDLTKKSRLGAMLGRRNFNARRTYNAEDLGFSDSRRCLGKRDVFHAFPKPGDPYGHFLSRRTIDGHNAFDVNAACLNFPGSDPKLCKSRNSHPQAMYQDDWTAGHAVELLQAAPADKPWFLWVSFPGPHDPFDVTGPMAAAVDGLEWPASVDPTRTEKTKASGGYPSHRNTRANYAAEIENLDRLFGAILDGAKARGHTLAKDLIVCVCSDHGEMLNDHRSIGKSQPWQGSLNVPLVCAGPGIKRNSSLDLPVALLDLGATFLDFAGAKQAKGTSARSFRGLLAGDVDPENRNRTIVHSGLQSSNFDASSLQSSGRAASSRLGGAPNASTPSRARRRRSKLERWFSDAVDSDVNEFSWRTATLGRPGGHIYKLVCCKGKCPFAPSNVGPPDADGYTRLLYDTVADPYDMHDIRKEKPDVVAVLQDSLPRTHGFDCTRSSKRSSVAPAPEETAAEVCGPHSKQAPCVPRPSPSPSPSPSPDAAAQRIARLHSQIRAVRAEKVRIAKELVKVRKGVGSRRLDAESLPESL